MAEKKSLGTIIVKSVATTILGCATLACAQFSAYSIYDFIYNPSGYDFANQGPFASVAFFSALLSIGAGIATYDAFKSTMKDIKEYEKINKVKLEDIVDSK